MPGLLVVVFDPHNHISNNMVVERLMMICHFQQQHRVAFKYIAGSGIGRQLSLELGSKGCILVLWDFNESGNAETKQMIIDKGGRAIAYTVDVTNADNIRLTADKVGVML